MNFRLILMLALLGVVTAAATVTGLVHTEWAALLSVLVALITAGTLASRAPGKFFLHGLLAGFLGSTFTSLTQAAFIGQYLVHNPKALDSLKVFPGSLSPAMLFIVLIPLTAGGSGVITGVLAFAWARFTRRGPSST